MKGSIAIQTNDEGNTDFDNIVFTFGDKQYTAAEILEVLKEKADEHEVTEQREQLAGQVQELQNEFHRIDEALARRERLDGISTRWAKIEYLCKRNGEMEQALRDVRSVTGFYFKEA